MKRKKDIFDLIENLSKKSFPKSKHPISDYIACHAGEIDPNDIVISLDIARQIEYNLNYYRKRLESAESAIEYIHNKMTFHPCFNKAFKHLRKFKNGKIKINNK